MHKYGEGITLRFNGENSYWFISSKLRKVQKDFSVSKAFINASERIKGCISIPEPGKFIFLRTSLSGQEPCSSDHRNCNCDGKGINNIPTSPLSCFLFLMQLFPHKRFCLSSKESLAKCSTSAAEIFSSIKLIFCTFSCKHLLYPSCSLTEVSSAPSPWLLIHGSS